MSYTTSSQGTVTFTGLAQGVHTFAVENLGTNGSVLATSNLSNWTVDLTPPTVSITAEPPAYSNSTTASFTVSGSDNITATPNLVYKVSLDSSSPSAFAVATSPVIYTNLSQGSHTFYVEDVDQAGNVSTIASDTWTVDTTPPTVSITSTLPPAYSNSTSASFSFTGSDNITATGNLVFKVSLDNPTAFAVASSPVSYTNLPQGQNTFYVEAVDQAGNVSSVASTSWIVDTAPPTVSAIGVTTSNGGLNYAFTFTGSDTISASNALVFYSSFDAGAVVAGSSLAESNLSPGSRHTIQVYAVDQAGNQSATVSSSFTVGGGLTLADAGGVYNGTPYTATSTVTDASGNPIASDVPTLTYKQGNAH